MSTPRTLPIVNLAAPRTRAECIDGPRPCPWRACRHHIEGASHSCALDVADEGDHTLAEVAEVLGYTLQRIHQIEARALAKVAGRIAHIAGTENQV